jgi:hypothetical protein
MQAIYIYQDIKVLYLHPWRIGERLSAINVHQSSYCVGQRASSTCCRQNGNRPITVPLLVLVKIEHGEHAMRLRNERKQMQLRPSSMAVLFVLCAAVSNICKPLLLEPVSFYVDSLR